MEYTKGYAEDGEQLTDKEVREAADNLLGLCNKIVEIETKKDECSGIKKTSLYP